MSTSNVGVVIAAIVLSKKIAACPTPVLRFTRTRSDIANKEIAKEAKPMYPRVIKTISFILSLIGPVEAAIATGTAVCLIARSFFHLQLLHMSTAVENAVMKGRDGDFWDSLSAYAVRALPTSALYAVFNYLLSELAIHVRQKVTERLLSKFTTGTVYYQIINAEQLSRISGENLERNSVVNPDQTLTIDIEHFSYALSGLFSHVMRPTVDILVNAERLYTTSGALMPTMMGVYLVVTTNILNAIRGPVTSFTQNEQELEGEYRTLIARVASSAQEIAALDGGRNEENNILLSFHPLIAYSRRFAQFRCNMSFIDSVVARYWLMILGWRLVGHYFLGLQQRGGSEHLTEDLYSDYQNMSKQMLMLSTSIGTLIMSGKDIVKVFAYGEKLSEFEETMDAIIRCAVDTECGIEEGASMPRSNANPVMLLSSSMVVDNNDNDTTSTSSSNHKLHVEEYKPASTCIIMENVSITPPSHQTPLHTKLNITFRSQMHTIITGANGAGKSSLLRVLAGIWPPSTGKVLLPPVASSSSSILPSVKLLQNSRLSLLYLPQKPYMTLGTLRDQIVYPQILPHRDYDTFCKDEEDSITHSTRPYRTLDVTLQSLLEQVYLGYLLKADEKNPVREDGSCHLGQQEQQEQQQGYTFDTILDWSDALSGGEKQRLSMARLLYHRPTFALLDECTSAISSDVEEEIFARCIQETETTLITIAHGPNLIKFHKYELRLQKNDFHTFTRLDNP